MTYIIDIILIVVFVLIVAIAAKRGIVLTAFDLAAGLISFLGAKLLSPYCADFLYAKFVQPKVITYLDGVYDGVNKQVSDAVDSAVSAFDFLPKGILKYVQEKGLIDSAKIADSVTGSIITTADLEREVVSPVVTSLLKVLSFVLIAIVLLVLLKIVAHIISKFIQKSKTADTLNSVLGGVFGILKGGVYVLILAALVNVVSCSSPKLAEYAASSKICTFVGQIIGM